MNYKMTVQYDGTRYSGWQRQGNTSATIQAKIEQTLSRLLEEPIEISGSGRTDAGVHALGQVVNFRSQNRIDCDAFLITLNLALPEDITVTDLRMASDRFRARLDAKEKTYRYTINNSPFTDVFRRKYEYQLPELLDVAAMTEASSMLLGTHDFKGFSTGRTKKSTIRTIKAISIWRDGHKVYLEFTGNGFLYNMVRILTGTLIEIGLHQREVDSISRVFETKNRADAGFTAPPQGLCLMEVTY